MNEQKQMPLVEALERMRKDRLVPFDVPGHKRGKGNAELTAFLGEQCLSVDVNSMKPLDNLCHPTGVIKESERLAAKAFGAAHAFFMVGGTTSAVQTMILACIKHKEEIILPRNVHQSVINALVLCGGIPVYINPQTDDALGIALGMRVEDVEQAIQQHPNAKAIFINNPTYYGICSNLKTICEIAHAHGLKVLVDEAHGTHFYFGEGLPMSAMAAKADMAAVSMHKSGGSLTQSSLLLCGEKMNPDYVRTIINLTQTTSASYLLMASLDIARRNLALHGKEMFEKVKKHATYARDEINAIPDYYAYAKELINGNSVYDFDVTKLSVCTLGLGLSGIEVYDLLRDEYGIQIEFGDLGNILAYLSLGDKNKNVERLVSALSDIQRNHKKPNKNLSSIHYVHPKVVVSLQDAFYAQKESFALRDCIGKVSGEFVMCYPPGIPIIAPGEFISEEIIDYIEYAKRKGCVLTGPECKTLSQLKVLKGEQHG